MAETPQALYSALIVCDDAAFVRRLKARLPSSRIGPDTVCKTTAEAARLTASGTAYDLVLIDAPWETAESFAFSLCERSGAAVLLFTAEEAGETEWRLASHGVAAVPKSLSPQLFAPVLGLLCGTRERLRRMEKKARTADEKMEEIRLCNRAKWLLIERVGMTEPDAHRYIEKAAMDRCMTKRAIAESIIKTYS